MFESNRRTCETDVDTEEKEKRASEVTYRRYGITIRNRATSMRVRDVYIPDALPLAELHRPLVAFDVFIQR